MLQMLLSVAFSVDAGQIHGRGEGEEIETPGRSKVGSISPRMHQNSPVCAQKSGVSPSPVGRGQPLPTSYPLGASIFAPTALIDLTRARRLRLLHSPPSHTFWIRPCVDVYLHGDIFLHKTFFVEK